MKKLKIIITAFSLCLTAILAKEKEYRDYVDVNNEPVIVADDQIANAAIDKWDYFIEAVIWQESKNDSRAIGDSGKAVGVLQIHPIMVREANRILAMKDESKADYYKYDDRYSREKSIEIFKIVQDYHNKSHDFDKALQIWNKNHPASYRNGIMEKYKELTS